MTQRGTAGSAEDCAVITHPHRQNKQIRTFLDLRLPVRRRFARSVPSRDGLSEPARPCYSAARLACHGVAIGGHVHARAVG